MDDKEDFETLVLAELSRINRGQRAAPYLMGSVFVITAGIGLMYYAASHIDNFLAVVLGFGGGVFLAFVSFMFVWKYRKVAKGP